MSRTPHQLRRLELAAELLERELSPVEASLLDAFGEILATRLGQPDAVQAHQRFRELLEEPEVQALAHAVRKWLRS